MAFLDRLRHGASTLLEHEIPSPDELRTVVGALIKGLEETIGSDAVAEIHTALIDGAAVPTNDPGNAGDANGSAPPAVQQAMPSADDIAQALIRAGYGSPAEAGPGQAAAAPLVSQVPADTPAPSEPGTHVADPGGFVPSPLPEPRQAPTVATTDEPGPPLTDEAVAAILRERGLSEEAISSALSADPPSEPAPSEPAPSEPAPSAPATGEGI